MSDAPAPIFRRILLKLSGESLMGSLDYGTDPVRLSEVAHERLPRQLQEDAPEGGFRHRG